MPTAVTLDAPVDAAALLLAVWPTVQAVARTQARRRGLDADDIAQAAAVRIIASAARFDHSRPGCNPHAWAHTITRWTAAGLAAEGRRLLSLDAATEDGGRIFEPADPGAVDPAEAAEWAELHAGVRAAVDALPARERAVVLARYVEGLEQAQVGAILGVSGARAGQMEARAVRRLAEARSARRLAEAVRGGSDYVAQG